MSRFSEFELKHNIYLNIFWGIIVCGMLAFAAIMEMDRSKQCIAFCKADKEASFQGKVVSKVIEARDLKIAVNDHGIKIEYSGSWNGNVYQSKVGDSVIKDKGKFNIRIFRDGTELNTADYKQSLADTATRTCEGMCSFF